MDYSDLRELFDSELEQIYPETTTIGFIEYDTVLAIKRLDPIAYDEALKEYIDRLHSDDEIYTDDNGENYYWVKDRDQDERI